MCGWQNHCEVVSVAFQQKAHSHIACVDSCGWSLQEKRTTIKKGMAKYMAMAESTLGDEVWIGYLNRDSNREIIPSSGHVISTSGQLNNPFELLSLVLHNVTTCGTMVGRRTHLRSWIAGSVPRPTTIAKAQVHRCVQA